MEKAARSIAGHTYPHRLECSTPIGIFTITFTDTESLLITLPSAKCGIRFQANLDQAHADRRGGVLRLTGEIRRNIAYTTNAPVLQHDSTLLLPDARAIYLLVDASEGKDLCS